VSRLETKGLSLRRNRSLFNHFVVEFDDDFSQDLQDPSSARGEVIVPTTTFSVTDGGLRAQPSVSLQAFQQRIERARADIVAMSAQLAQHPLADDGMLGGVVKDMDLPEAQQDFARQQLAVSSRHSPGEPIITATVNEIVTLRLPLGDLIANEGTWPCGSTYLYRCADGRHPDSPGVTRVPR
jgi:hypothetical protein